MLCNKAVWCSVIVVVFSLALYSFNSEETMIHVRRGVWFVKGLMEYTKGGYEKAAKNFKPEDLEVNCAGKSYLITGANSGIGKSVALEVARRGGTVHMVCRNLALAEAASVQIRDYTGNMKVHIHILDLSKPRDVIAFVQSFRGPLDVLVNNAGCMVNTREVDHDGLEKNFATNVLGTYLLTSGLLTMLEASSEPRVITVSSGGMLTQKLNVSDLQSSSLEPFDGRTAYAQNKRAQIIMTEWMARENPRIHFSTMHPGWADTVAVRTSMPDFYESMKNRLRTEEQGADTALWLAISPAALTHPTGLFFQDRVPVSTHLPLAGTQSTEAEESNLMSQLNTFRLQYNRATCS